MEGSEKNVKELNESEINLKMSKPLQSCEYFKGGIDVSSSFDLFRLSKDESRRKP